MDKLTGRVRAAVQKYDLIDEGDKIAVGVSGGKDSLFLLCALAELSHYYPKHYTVTAVTADPCFGGVPGDYSQVQRLCDSLSVPYIIRKTDLGPLIFEERKEENPCSLCAAMRRGILHNLCLELGLNKLALGHHFDDAVQTFFMNLSMGGRSAAFPQDLPFPQTDHCHPPPGFLRGAGDQGRGPPAGPAVVKSACPADGVTARKDTEELVKKLEKDFPHLRQKVLGAHAAGRAGWMVNQNIGIFAEIMPISCVSKDF